MLIAIPGQRSELLHPPAASGIAARDPGPLGQVVVIGPAPAPASFHVVAGAEGALA